MAAASNNEFQLIVPEAAQRAEVPLGSDFTVPCHLSPEISAVAMEIRWFKETDCVCVYKNREVSEGRGYEDRVRLSTELERGRVSLTLRDFRWSDSGDYLSQVTIGDRTEEMTVRVVVRELTTGRMVVFIREINRTWTEEERMKIEESALMTDASDVSCIAGEDTSASTAPVRRRQSMEGLPPLMSEETSSPKSPVLVLKSELRLVLLGRTGSGKSGAGNIILGREERSQTGTSTETQQSESRQGEVAGRQVTVVDTPDWFCSGLSLEEVRQDVGLCVRLSAPGPHAFLLVIPVKQSTGEERGMLEKMEEIFGERCWKNTMILFTVTDEEQEKNIEQFVQSGNQELQRLLEKCKNRFHCLNNNQTGDGSQVSELLEKIEKMETENTERFYSSEIYLETESQIREMEKKIMREREERKEREEREMKEKIEKAVQNSLSKIEGVIQEHETDIKQLNERTDKLERQMKEERDEEKKKELERELEKEMHQRTELKKEINRLKEKRERERSEMEERHRQEMEKIREMYKGDVRMETERNLMKIILPELQRNLMISTFKMKQKILKQLKIKGSELDDKNKELEIKLKTQVEIENQLKELQTKLDNTTEQLAGKISVLQDNEKQLNVKNTQIQKLEKQLLQTTQTVDEKNTELENMSKLMSEKERLLENTVKEMETSKHQVETLRNELQDKSSQLQLLLEEKKILKSSDASAVSCTPGGEISASTEAPVKKKDSKGGLPPLMSGETTSPQPPVLRLVLLESTGSGKSAAGNIILGREDRRQTGTSTETQQSESRQGEVAGRQVTVVDTPDWFCSGLSLEEVRQDVGLCVRLSAPGPHAFLLVIPVKQSTGEERGMLEKMEEIFGERCWRNTMILFTVTDKEQKKNIEEFVQSGNQELQRLVKKCGNRFHCLNINQSGDGSQVSELLEKIEKMEAENTERFYSSEIYLETETQIREMERKIMREREERDQVNSQLEEKESEIQALKVKLSELTETQSHRERTNEGERVGGGDSENERQRERTEDERNTGEQIGWFRRICFCCCKQPYESL